MDVELVVIAAISIVTGWDRPADKTQNPDKLKMHIIQSSDIPALHLMHPKIIQQLPFVSFYAPTSTWNTVNYLFNYLLGTCFCYLQMFKCYLRIPQKIVNFPNFWRYDVNLRIKSARLYRCLLDWVIRYSILPHFVWFWCLYCLKMKIKANKWS